MTHKCRKCGADLVIGTNWTTYRQKQRQYICTSCRLIYQCKYQRERSHRLGIHQPMGENKECSQYLGIHIAEQVLSHVFENVKQMPLHNPGYDFTCGGGYDVDVKSSCRHNNGRWMFNIKRNTIANYFLFLAFDSREDLNPQHIWLIPGNIVNHLVGASITPSTIHKWDKYRLNINKVIKCCNIMKGD